MTRLISGGGGRAFSEAGILASVISGEGRVRASNQAFALRATGRVDANIAGRNFINFLRADDKGTIFFEREGRHGTPVRLFHIPLERESDKAPALILLIDDDGGMVERGKALEQVESMLSLLPLGLALADRDGRFLFLNEAFAKIAGIGEKEQPLYPGDLMPTPCAAMPVAPRWPAIWRCGYATAARNRSRSASPGCAVWGRRRYCCRSATIAKSQS